MDQSVSSRSSKRVYWSTEDVRQRVEKSRIVVFAKGTPESPCDGFSERALQAVLECGRPYEIVNVMEDRSIGAALRVFAGTSHLPLIFVNGEVVSTSDNLTGMLSSGELNSRLKSA